MTSFLRYCFPLTQTKTSPLMRKHLRLTQIKPIYSFSSLKAPAPLILRYSLVNLAILTLAASDLIFCFTLHSYKSAECLGTQQELHVTTAFRSSLSMLKGTQNIPCTGAFPICAEVCLFCTPRHTKQKFVLHTHCGLEMLF